MSVGQRRPPVPPDGVDERIVELRQLLKDTKTEAAELKRLLACWHAIKASQEDEFERFQNKFVEMLHEWSGEAIEWATNAVALTYRSKLEQMTTSFERLREAMCEQLTSNRESRDILADFVGGTELPEGYELRLNKNPRKERRH